MFSLEGSEEIQLTTDGSETLLNGLFGWVYDIMIIEPWNKVKQLRVDAGTSTILSVKTGGK